MRPLVLLISLLAGCPPAPSSDDPPPSTARDAGLAEPPCLRVVPASIDFGEVREATSKFVRIEVTNTSKSGRTLEAIPLPQEFSVSPPLEIFGVSLPSRTGRAFELQFRPTDARLHLATLELSAGMDCVAQVPLRGLGMGALKAASSTLDFGFVPPGQQKRLQLQLLNTRREEVTLSAYNLTNRTLPVFSANNPGSVVVPAMGSLSIEVTASPPDDDTFFGDFVAASSAGLIAVALKVTAGAPVAQLSPASFALPRVGLVPGSMPPSFADRLLHVRNVSPLGRSSDAQLRLVAPFFNVHALDGGPVDELIVATAPLLTTGLGQDAGAEVLLHFVPRSVGARSYRVTLFTNDPVRAEQAVTFQAQAVALPECSWSVWPAGVVELAPTLEGSEGMVTFTNTGSSLCVLDDLRLSEFTPSTFRITSGGEAQVALAPGGAHTVTISGPRGSFENSGALSFHVFNPHSVRQEVLLRAPP